MLFSSFVFISLFLPLVLSTYYLVPRVARNYVLLLASMIFYAWGDLGFLWIMVGVITVNYVGALVLESLEKARNGLRLGILLPFVIANLAGIFYYKYFDFTLSNLAELFSFEYTLRHIVLPLGISFYTFQGLSYLVDVYRGDAKAQRNPLTFALFISYFPQLVAGPILKYHDVQAEMAERRETFSLFAYGLRRFVFGFAKKVIVANSLAVVADLIFNEPPKSYGTLVAWGGIVSYALQLYYDFSGYSDMAIGLGAMFGFHFKENFNYPFVSRSVSEIWTRWHISLSTWFKEYLYIPLGGSRCTLWRSNFNMLFVFFVTGLWHGAEWTCILWGVFNGLFIVFERLTGWHRMKGGWWLDKVHLVYANLAFLLTLSFFRCTSLAYTGKFIRNLFGLLTTEQTHVWQFYFTHWSLFVGILAAIGAFGLMRNVLAWANLSPVRQLLLDVGLLILFVFSLASLAGATYNPFIYFRF